MRDVSGRSALGCDGAAALLIRSTLLAIQLRELADFPRIRNRHNRSTLNNRCDGRSRRRWHSARLSGLNVRLDVSLAQGFLDAQFDRVLADRSVTLGDDDDLTEHVGTLVGQRKNDFVVDVVPVLPGQSLDVDSDPVQPPFTFLDDDLPPPPLPSRRLPSRSQLHRLL